MSNLPVRKPVPPSLQPYLKRWYSNDSPNRLGVIDFCFSLLHKTFNGQYGTARWHHSALYDLLAWKPTYTKEDQSYVTATYREGSKTSYFAYAIPLYMILVGQYGIYHKGHLLPEYDYIIIRCKTGREAKKRLLNIAATLKSDEVKAIFGDLNPKYQEVRDKKAKDGTDLLILSNGYIIECSGVNQPIRGANIFSRRPKFIIYDDPQHLENVKTQERRDALEMDIYEESFGALDTNGIMYYIANKVHSMDMLGILLNNSTWRKQFHTLTYIDKDGVEKSDWEKKFPMGLIEKRKAWYLANPKYGKRSYYKNFYNKIIADIDTQIKYHNAEYKNEFGINWLRFKTPTGYIHRNVNITIACDPAISGTSKSDDAVISAVAFAGVKTDGEGFTSPKRRYYLESSVGKFDIHDRFPMDVKKPVLAIEPEETALIIRRGCVEEIARMYIKYKADSIVVENCGQQGTFVNELRELLNRMGYFPPILPANQTENKVERIKTNLMCFFEAGLCYLRKNMGSAIEEVNSFPHSGLHSLDSFELAERMGKFPPLIEYNPFGINRSKPTKSYQDTQPKRECEDWICY